MYDQTTQHAINNLARWVEEYRAENVGKATPSVVSAAEYLLRVTSPEAVEDREYHSVDLALPEHQRCGAIGEYGRICFRRANHVSPDHRSLEFSWKDQA